MATPAPKMDMSFSCEIGDDLRVFGSRSAISRVQELYGRRDERRDPGLQRNTRREGQRDGLGIEILTVGRDKQDEPLDVTGNTDAMTRMQTILLADDRRRAAARFADIGDLGLSARLAAKALKAA